MLTAQVLLPVILFKLVALVILAGKCFDHTHAGEILLQGGRKDGFLLLECFVSLGDLAEEEDRGDDDDRYYDDRKQSQLDI